MPDTESSVFMTSACECGHIALAHHGVDHGPESHQGCQYGSHLRGYCPCPKTATEVTLLPDPMLPIESDHR